MLLLMSIVPYHPKCSKIKLTHLCFVDVLIIFTKGDVASLQAITTILQLFFQLSGLQCNSSKNEFFCCGVDASVSSMQRITEFKAGRFPVRYF
jgi:hypothetical protein